MLNGAPTLACILSTYKRERQALTRVGELASLARRLPAWHFDVLVADDDPDSELGALLPEVDTNGLQEFRYMRRARNLGQGRNMIAALAECGESDYVWFPGDDDQLMVDELEEFFIELLAHRPTCGVFGFRQGLNGAGTSFSGNAHLLRGSDESIACVVDFGKLTNLVVKSPPKAMVSVLSVAFDDSMFQDKALAVMAIRTNPKGRVLVWPRVCAEASPGYQHLRYSQRAFANLGRTVQLAKGCASEEGVKWTGFPELSKSDQMFAWRLWAKGLVDTALPGRELNYTLETALRELVWPFRELWRVLNRRAKYFETN